MNTSRKLFPFWVPLLFGLMGVFRIVGNPRFTAIRTIDIVRLLAIGLCFGVALAALVAYLRSPR